MLGHSGLLGDSIPKSGNLAVQVFFALSGWLIGGILLAPKRTSLPQLFFNRSMRIWASYCTAFAFLGVASLLREPLTVKWLEFMAYKATFVWNLFGTQQLATQVAAMPLRGTGNHFWSVNAEEQFYLLAPVVIAIPFFGRRVALWLLIAVVCWWFDMYASIVLGVLAASINQAHPGFQKLESVRIASAVAGLAAAAVMATSLDCEHAAPVFGACTVLLLAVEGQRARLGSFSGGLSYQLCLNHWIGGFAATVLLIPFGLGHDPIHLYLGVVLNLCSASALYWYVDRRLLANRKAWFTPLRGCIAMSLAYAIVTVDILYGLAMLRMFEHA